MCLFICPFVCLSSMQCSRFYLCLGPSLSKKNSMGGGAAPTPPTPLQLFFIIISTHLFLVPLIQLCACTVYTGLLLLTWLLFVYLSICLAVVHASSPNAMGGISLYIYIRFSLIPCTIFYISLYHFLYFPTEFSLFLYTSPSITLCTYTFLCRIPYISLYYSTYASIHSSKFCIFLYTNPYTSLYNSAFSSADHISVYNSMILCRISFISLYYSPYASIQISMLFFKILHISVYYSLYFSIQFFIFLYTIPYVSL